MKHYLLTAFVVISVLAASCTGKNNSGSQKKIQDTVATIDILNEQLAKDPDNAGLLFERATLYYELKQLDKGMVDIQRAVSIDSSKSDYFLLRSDYYYATNKISDARADIEKAIKIDPKNKEANVKMGELAFYLGDYAAAFKYLDDALRLDPHQAKVYFIKGMCFKENGDTALAVSSFRTAVEQDPDYFHAYMQLASIFAAKNDPIAIDYYNNAIMINPNMVEAHYGLAYFLQEHGKPDGAIKVYNDLLSIDPTNSPAMHNIGYIFLYDKGDYPGAINWFTRAIAADPNIVNGYYHRGLAYEQMGNFAEARKDYEKALQLEPEFQLAKERLGKIKGK